MQQSARGSPRAAQQRGDEAVLLFEEREQEVIRLDGGMLELLRGLLGRGQRFLGSFGKSIQSHSLVNTTAHLRANLSVMRLTVLGSGSAFSNCGCNAGYLVDGRLLVDCGAPVPALLRRARTSINQ